MRRDPDPTVVAGVGVSRRGLLWGGAALAGGLLVGIELPSAPARAEEPVPTGPRFNAFIHVAPDDTVTFTLPAVEMGQGVYTSQGCGQLLMFVEQRNAILVDLLPELVPPTFGECKGSQAENDLRTLWGPAHS